MSFVTGSTIYETVVSVDNNNNPVSGATFNILLFNDGQIYNSIVVSSDLIDATQALFTFSYTPIEEGQYQVYAKNSITNVIWVSDIKTVLNQNEGSSSAIYVGL